VPSHPRTAQTSPLSRFPRYSPPPPIPSPSPSSLLLPPRTPCRNPPSRESTRNPVSIRRRVRGPTYSTGSATDNEIVYYHSCSFSLSFPFSFSVVLFLFLVHSNPVLCSTRFLLGLPFPQLSHRQFLHASLFAIKNHTLLDHGLFSLSFAVYTRLGCIGRPCSLI